MRGFIGQYVGHGDNPLAAQSKTGEPSLAKEATDTFGMPSPAGSEFCRGKKFPGPFWVVGRCCHARDDALGGELVNCARWTKGEKKNALCPVAEVDGWAIFWTAEGVASAFSDQQHWPWARRQPARLPSVFSG